MDLRTRHGELVHVDVKKLGRIARSGHRVKGSVAGGGHHRRAYNQGWEYVHVCVGKTECGPRSIRSETAAGQVHSHTS
jgi:hypothetical protein